MACVEVQIQTCEESIWSASEASLTNLLASSSSWSSCATRSTSFPSPLSLETHCPSFSEALGSFARPPVRFTPAAHQI